MCVCVRACVRASQAIATASLILPELPLSEVEVAITYFKSENGLSAPKGPLSSLTGYISS